MAPPGLTISRRLALALAPVTFLVAVLVHSLVPWAISFLGPRHGWSGGRPATWNLLGLIPVAAGSLGLLWVMVTGIAQAREVPERVALDWSPKLLMRRGPYAFTRNPMYVAETALWVGWAIFFGSLAISIGLAMLLVVIVTIVRREERDLDARFGDAYREYKRSVPRWLGMV